MLNVTRRCLIQSDPYIALSGGDGAMFNRHWPARWIGLAGVTPPLVAAYRLTFEVERATTLRVHVSADERYQLRLDGQPIGRGPERGDRWHWCYESYELSLDAGRHTLLALTWALGYSLMPYAQFTVRPGFLLAAESPWTDALSTGVAAWQVKRVEGYGFTPESLAWGAGCRFELRRTNLHDEQDWLPATPPYASHWRAVSGERWRDWGLDDRLLWPAVLPAMLDEPWRRGTVRQVDGAAMAKFTRVEAKDHLEAERGLWQGLFSGKPMQVPANTRRRVIVDLEDYVCAYPSLTLRGGADATLRCDWAEALFLQEDNASEKGQRDAIDQKYFRGVGDSYHGAGGDEPVTLEPLWWHCGRFLQLHVQTKDQPLVIEKFELRETRFPDAAGRGNPGLGKSPAWGGWEFECDDAELMAAWPLMVRTLQMCSHETYFDCPYYEQLMYVGDTRLQVLVTYMLRLEDSLPRKAITMLGASRLADGLTQSRYPSKLPQIIGPFSLWWVMMVHDAAAWRGDRGFVAGQLPGVRAVLDAFLQQRDSDGLAQPTRGWNFVDWVESWDKGMPEPGDSQPICPIQWQLVLALQAAVELEDWAGEPDLARRYARTAKDLQRAVVGAYFDESRGLFADDLRHQHWSEHSQALALLCGSLDQRKRSALLRRLLTTPDLARCTIYFSHYLFEVFSRMGKIDALQQRLNEWRSLPGLGFKTVRECPEPSRSDCHAWGAHPIYHAVTTFLGVRPVGLGMDRVDLRPQLGTMRRVAGSVPTPRGWIRLAWEREGQALLGRVELPEGLAARLHTPQGPRTLNPGTHEVRLELNRAT